MSVNNQSVDFAVISATVAGELYRAGNVAKKLSLAAKNSRAVVLRAGSNAAGLKVISDYFAELAANAISLSSQVNAVALSVSQMAVERWHRENLTKNLNRSQSLHHHESLEKNVKQVAEQMTEINGRFRQSIGKLKDQLDDIHNQMQASSVVAVTFRLEATQTGEFRPLLEDMANNIEGYSADIKSHIQRSQLQIAQLGF